MGLVGGHPGTGHLIGVRYSLPGNVGNPTDAEPASSNPNVGAGRAYSAGLRQFRNFPLGEECPGQRDDVPVQRERPGEHSGPAWTPPGRSQSNHEARRSEQAGELQLTGPPPRVQPVP